MLLAAVLAASLAIRVDQTGYAASETKTAVVAASAAKTFVIVTVPEGQRVYEGRLSPAVHDRDSGERVQLADFSPLSAEGLYAVRAGEETSAAFPIGDRSRITNLLALTMRSYNGQRCGTAVDLGGGYSHPACHTTNAPRGGWHDAGDYGRYVVNSGITTGTLLWAHELFGLDALDEIRWNVEWMLAMQDSDGGVHHKQTSLDFAPFVMPQDDLLPSHIIGKGSCATGDFAAVMAIAGRVYDEKRFTDAALRAWSWLDAHPHVTFRNPPGVLTGEYGDRDCSDERAWAAAELWRTTREPRFGAFFRAHVPMDFDSPPDWQNVGPLAAWAYALSTDDDAAQRIRKRSIAAADAIVARSRRHAYRIPMRTRDYVWGSNAVAANYGLQLLIANEMRRDERYIDASSEILHYLLGRNPFSISWVTGVGATPIMHPHHRPSAADNIIAPWPGLLAGGPNRNRQDPVLKRLPPNVPPARMYADDQESYASNEVAINWNAPLVFVLSGLKSRNDRGAACFSTP